MWIIRACAQDFTPNDTIDHTQKRIYKQIQGHTQKNSVKQPECLNYGKKV